ncbi:MAG: tRNA pseudouridine(55) synthase TruB [Ilumatobacter sp.]|nr:tRNA pseudouridine(55) synthase TruB [Ilumatobacter sp.]
MTSQPALDGVLVVDKPPGPTSHDIVAAARRALGLRKIGHLGTLDPMASGVLPLVVGRATRLASLFAGADKQYEAGIKLGLATDSYDITGTVVGGTECDASGSREPAPPTADEIRRTAAEFVGTHPQRPPPVSAKKIGGVRAYELARRDQPVNLAPVIVTIEQLSLLAIDGMRVRCRVVSSSGFYVRSLAHDLGERLGCGGCLETLRRERHGPFGLDQAVTLESLLEQGPAAGSALLPMAELVPDLPAVTVTPGGARRAGHGNSLGRSDIVPSTACQEPAHNSRIRIMDDAGLLLAIGEFRPDGLLHPKIVLV